MSFVEPNIEAELLQLLRACEGLPPQKRQREAEALNAFMIRLSEGGWNRKKIYDFMMHEADKQRSVLPEDSFDALSDCISALMGEVSSDAYVRLKGEPEGDEFYHYVFQGKWKEGNL